MLVAVRNDVMSETARKQVPWEHSALTGRFYFSSRPAPAPGGSTSLPSEAAEAWDRVKDSRDAATLEIFAARYKDTYYADLARARLAATKNVVVAPPQLSKFDGTWLATMKCPKTGPMVAYTIQYDVHVENGNAARGNGVAR